MKKNFLVFESIGYSLYFLAVTLLLSSCGASIYNSKEEQPVENIRRLTHQHAIEYLLGQKYTADNGSIVAFYEQQGKLQADVWIDEMQKKPNYKKLPVFISSEVDISQLSHMGKEAEKRMIHMQMPQGSQPGRVFIFKGGLVGGVHFIDVTVSNNTDQDITFELRRGEPLLVCRSRFPVTVSFSNNLKNHETPFHVAYDMQVILKAHTQQIITVHCNSTDMIFEVDSHDEITHKLPAPGRLFFLDELSPPEESPYSLTNYSNSTNLHMENNKSALTKPKEDLPWEDYI